MGNRWGAFRLLVAGGLATGLLAAEVGAQTAPGLRDAGEGVVYAVRVPF